MRLLIFGTGQFFQKRKDSFSEEEIVAFVDNDEKKWGQTFEGLQVISPSNIQTMNYDFICLMVKGEYAEQMRKQLEELKVPYEKIIDYYEFGLLNDGNQVTVYYGRKCVPMQQATYKVLLLTHELSYSGAPLVLFYVAQILRKRGCFVVVMSLKDGELRKNYIKEGISVAIQDDLRRFDPVLFEWFKEFDLVWGNTVTYYYWAEAFARSKTPFIWWLHESAEAYEWLGPHRMPRKLSDMVRIYAAGSLALRMAQKYIPSGEIETLLYGAPDFGGEENGRTKKKREKVIFGMIGTICPRKAQDILLEAVMKLMPEEREKAEFWIIGSVINQEFYKEICQKIEMIPEVKFLGAYNREEMKRIYAEIDIIVCPSREDPLPVVVTEAMIMSKPSIVSTMTGTADLINDKENGFVCEAENPEDLVSKMRWALINQDKLESIGQNARELYDEHFSMEVFEQNVWNIVNVAVAEYMQNE